MTVVVGAGLSQLQVINRALTFLGENAIFSRNDGSAAAEIVDNIYPITLTAALQRAPWSFCRRQATLNRLVQTPQFGFANAYQLPADCIVVLNCNARPFQLYVDRLYTDRGDPVRIEYRYQPVEPELPAHFIDAMTKQLAADMALSITENSTRRTEWTQSAELPSRSIRRSRPSWK